MTVGLATNHALKYNTAADTFVQAYPMTSELHVKIAGATELTTTSCPIGWRFHAFRTHYSKHWTPCQLFLSAVIELDSFRPLHCKSWYSSLCRQSRHNGTPAG